MQELQQKIRDRKEQERERLLPEIDRMQNLILDLQKEIELNNGKIEKEENENDRIEKVLSNLDEKKDGLRDDNESEYQKYLKVKDDPIRLEKQNLNLKQGVTVLQSEVEKV